MTHSSTEGRRRRARRGLLLAILAILAVPAILGAACGVRGPGGTTAAGGAGTGAWLSLTMVDGRHGWARRRAAVVDRERPRHARDADAGLHWTAFEAQAPTPLVQDVRMVSATVGLAIGVDSARLSDRDRYETSAWRRLLRTEDGGRTWQPVSGAPTRTASGARGTG
jgi:hypothetical protein